VYTERRPPCTATFLRKHSAPHDGLSASLEHSGLYTPIHTTPNAGIHLVHAERLHARPPASPIIRRLPVR
jgi:hypothetical protein